MRLRDGQGLAAGKLGAFPRGRGYSPTCLTAEEKTDAQSQKLGSGVHCVFERQKNWKSDSLPHETLPGHAVDGTCPARRAGSGTGGCSSGVSTTAAEQCCEVAPLSSVAFYHIVGIQPCSIRWFLKSQDLDVHVSPVITGFVTKFELELTQVSNIFEFTQSGYFGKSTSAYLRNFLEFNAFLVSGSTAVCSEAHRSWFPLDFSSTFPYPPSSFLHPVPLLLPVMSRGACASPLADWRHPGAATLNAAPPPVGAVLCAQLGTPGIHLSQTQLPVFTFGLSLSHTRKWTSGRRQEEGWGDGHPQCATYSSFLCSQLYVLNRYSEEPDPSIDSRGKQRQTGFPVSPLSPLDARV
ncbi:hypothetical protein EK904_008120 [Melospiza melodia maxima]|nr:hypothetical protein EK904_008120 [Melospiza melodia maxima]